MIEEKIVEALRMDNSLDIKQVCQSLSKPDGIINCIAKLVELYAQSSDILKKNRCLSIIIYLLDLLDNATQKHLVSDFKLFHEKFFRSLYGIDWNNYRQPVIFQDLIRACRSLSHELLRKKIVEMCPKPPLDKPGTIRSQLERYGSPVRLDLGMGGISDIPPYCFEQWGSCVNLPVKINGNFPINVTVERLHKPIIRLESKDLDLKGEFTTINQMDNVDEFLKFHKEVVQFLYDQMLMCDSIDDFWRALDVGIRLSTSSSLPVGTGLGVSSLLLSCMFKSVARLCDFQPTDDFLYSLCVFVENVLEVGGGWEDIGGIYPGIRLMKANPARPFSPEIDRIDCDEATKREVFDRIVLIYTGIQKIRRNFFEPILVNYALRDKMTLDAINSINAINSEIKTAIIKRDKEHLGDCFWRQWEAWKVLSENRCTNTQIDELFESVKPYVYGARVNGAGSGGCAMFVARDDTKKALVTEIRRVLPKAEFYKWEPVLE